MNGSGFKSNEKLSLVSQSEEEVMPACPLQASKEGTIASGIAPSVVGKQYGRASIIITRQDGSKMPLKYIWGTTREKFSAMSGE